MAFLNESHIEDADIQFFLQELHYNEQNTIAKNTAVE